MPEEFGLVDCNTLHLTSSHFTIATPSQRLRRELTLVSKVLTNLSTQLEFGQKEVFMIPLNAFIQENSPVINKFYEEVTVNAGFFFITQF